MLARKLHIVPSMVDAGGHLKLVNFFLLFQDVANENAESIGAGKDATLDKGIDWVITRISLDIKRMPSIGEDVEIFTYPHGVKAGCIYFRVGGLKDKDGNIIILLNSMWSLIDNKSRKLILRPSIPGVLEEYNHELREPIKVPNEESKELFRKVIRYSDCDMNGHMNNTRYIEAITDTKTIEFYKHNYVSKLDLNFINEVYDGESLIVNVSKDETYVEGKKGESISFLAKLEYKSY